MTHCAETVLPSTPMSLAENEIVWTIVVAGGKAYVQSGAGIVADSVPEKEFEETVNKAKGLLVSIEMTAARLAARAANG